MTRPRAFHIQAGDLIQGRYRVGEELGRGGMSIVHRAHDGCLGRDVALKVVKLPEEDSVSSLFLQQEFRAMARLRHPRMVEVYDYGVVEPNIPFLTMELLPGTDLSVCSSLTLDEIYGVLISITEALAFMHSRGYVHRDVKPANVRVLSRRTGAPIEVKLMDCGLVEQAGDRAGAVAGTLTYLAPEAWLGAPADVRGDLYALGVLAYEITAGRPPFEATTGIKLLRVKTESAPDLRETRPDVPVAFARLVRDLIAAEPASRPAHALEVLARLGQFAAVDLASAPATYLRNPALVGRARELAELRKALREAASGKTTLVMIVAPSGAGKSRLLEEALLEAGLRGSLIASARGRGFGGAPYEVLQGLLSELLRAPGAADALERIGGKAALGPFGPGAHSVGAREPADRIGARRSLHAALCTLLENLSADRTIVLAIDDLHLADAASLEAIGAAIGSRGAKVVLLGTLRSDRSMIPPVEHIVSRSRLLVLERMTPAEISELLVRTLGPVSPNSTLVEDIRRSSGGNVSFVLEILRDLSRRGLIKPMRTKVRLPDALDTSDLPRNLAEALEHRIAVLSPPALAVARVVAVAGRSLDLDLVRLLAELDGDAFLDAVDELRREELVDVQELGIDIRHPRLREVLYQAIAAPQRKSLHRGLAAALDRRWGAQRHEHAAELGHHYAEGGVDRRAFECLILAGDMRYDGFAYFDAGEAYQRALGLLHAAPRSERDDLERKLHDRLGRIAFYHDLRSAPRHLERARLLHLRHGALWVIAPLARGVGPAIALAIGLVFTVLFNLARGRRNPLRLARGHLLDSFAATAYLCNCYTYAGRLAKALTASEHLSAFVYSKRRMARAGYLIARAPALLFMHRFPEAVAACEETLSILDHDHETPVPEHDRLHATSGALITLLWCDLYRGHLVSPWWQRLEAYVEAQPTALLEAWLMEARLYAACRRGNLPATRAAWQEFVENAKWTGISFIQGKGHVWLGMACLEAGHISEAEDVAEDVVREGRETDNPVLLAMGLWLRGMAFHAWEQLADADRAFEEARALVERSDVACLGVYREVLLAQAALCLDSNEPSRAAELAHRVDEESSRMDLPNQLQQLRARRILGRVALGRGVAEEALGWLTQSIELAECIEDPLERAVSLHYLAEGLTLAGDSEAADLRRAEAEQLLQEGGRAYQLRRLGYADHSSRDNIDVLESSRRTSDGSAAWAPFLDDPTSHLGDTQSALNTATDRTPSLPPGRDE